MTTINQAAARSIVQSIASESHADIIAGARKTRADIAQLFAEAEHWNRVNVPWKGPAINPDPDGQLKRLAVGLDQLLAAEKKPRLTPVGCGDGNTFAVG